MDGSEYTWNRFQMGWQIGVGFQYKPFYLGVQYGTDFIHAYSHKFEEDWRKIDSPHQQRQPQTRSRLLFLIS